uniref:Cysteine-rich neurotrophic factor n=1 Tax=Lymnaea stagnalis TaxID=6523 RepID=CRNF_LYMST|nr:RecName: Full=Cysteine-rich neurotrophic factor; Short=CRNF; Flags: Precursor [Lymnaea stagnalis]AAC47397.2 cysteine-rich neurotrophic factor precursor [Lymnaea stagnalis]
MLLKLIVALSLTLTLASATSDPKGWFCSFECNDWNQLEMACQKEKDCFEKTNNQFTNETVACMQPCWDLGIPCRTQCYKVYDQCTSDCPYTVPNPYECFTTCFKEAFAEVKPQIPKANLDE